VECTTYEVGYVPKFEVDTDYLQKFKVENAGGEIYNERWVPSEELEEFNKQKSDYICNYKSNYMQTRLVAIGNSYGIRLPKAIIKRFDLDKNDLEIIVKEDGILITPVTDVPPLLAWDKLFKEAKKKGFNAEEDAKEFSDWDTTLEDGLE
jgi:antitoxin component of MazEF toxin-antitoxin module